MFENYRGVYPILRAVQYPPEKNFCKRSQSPYRKIGTPLLTRRALCVAQSTDCGSDNVTPIMV